MSAGADTRRTPGRASRRPPRRYGALPGLGIALPGWRAFAVWRRHWAVFRPSWRSELVAPALEPVITFGAMGLGLGAYVELGAGEPEYIAFIAPGVLAMFPMFAGEFDALFGTYRRLHEEGTYDAIVATPVRVEEASLGDIMWAATRSMMSAAVILLVVLALTPRYDIVQSPLAPLVVLAAGMTGLALGGLAIAAATWARSISQLGTFFSLYSVPMFWVSGGFFPLDELPGWAQRLAWFLPLTHNVELNRDLIGGHLDWGTAGHFAWLAVAIVPSLWVALWAMRRRLVPE